MSGGGGGAGRRGSEGCGAQLRVLGPREAFRGALQRQSHHVQRGNLLLLQP